MKFSDVSSNPGSFSSTILEQMNSTNDIENSNPNNNIIDSKIHIQMKILNIMINLLIISFYLIIFY